MIKRDELKSFLRDQEAAAAAAHVRSTFTWLARGASARALVRAACISLGNIEEVAWLGFIPDGENLCYVGDSPTAPTMETAIPEQVLARLRSAAAEGARGGTGLDIERRCNEVVTAGTRWKLAENVSNFVLGRMATAEDGLTDGTSGIAIAALKESDVQLGVQASGAFERARRLIRDRIRFAALGDFVGLRVLASVDDEYQLGLLRARNEIPSVFVGSHGTVQGARSIDRLDSSYPVSAEVESSSEPNSSLDAMRIRSLLRESLEEGMVGGIDSNKISLVQISFDERGLLTPRGGKWVGYAEFAYGLADMRRGHAVLAIVDSYTQLSAVLRDYVRQHGLKLEKGTCLVLFAPTGFVEAAKSVLGEWSDIIDWKVRDYTG